MENILIITDSHFFKKNFQLFEKKNQKYNFIIVKSSTSFIKLKNLIRNKKIQLIIINFGLSGGIQYNIDNASDILIKNTEGYLKILRYLESLIVKKVFFISASCAYPKNLKILKETNYINPNLEKTSYHYAASKIIGSQFCENISLQKKFDWKSIVPATIYGPHSNGDLKNLHVINAFFQKFKTKKKEIEIWGSGNAKREFLHIQDFISALIFIHEKNLKRSVINVGYGKDISIKKLAYIFTKGYGFKGKLKWNKSKPEGAKRKLLDSSFLISRGWRPKITLEKGIINLINKGN